MTDGLSPEEQWAVLAAGFALELLDGEELAEALRLLHADPQFARDAARWDEEIDQWMGELPDSDAPTDAMWQRIAAGTGAQVVALHPVSSPVAATRPPSSSSWRITALAASVAAVLFASLWWTRPVLVPTAPDKQVAALSLAGLSVAQIQDAKDQRLVAAVYDRASGRLLARVSAIDTNGSTPELWLIGSDGKPRSLGVGRPGGEISITLPPEARDLFIDGATIAISLEPSVETLHATPQGPILGTASISAI